MAIVCPRCSTALVMPTVIAYSAACTLRCNRCNATWFAQAHVDDTFPKASGESPYLATRRSGSPRFERIIECDSREPRRGGGKVWAARPMKGGRDGAPHVSGVLGIGRRLFGGWLGAVAGVAVCGLIAVLALQSAVVGAAPAIDAAQFAGLDIRLVRATIDRVHNQKAVTIVGEIANRINADIAVPAVRIALLSGGSERQAWLHQPSELRIGGGAAVAFRIMLTSPPAGIDEVSFHLAPRPGRGVGTH